MQLLRNYSIMNHRDEDHPNSVVSASFLSTLKAMIGLLCNEVTLLQCGLWVLHAGKVFENYMQNACYVILSDWMLMCSASVVYAVVNCDNS